QAAEGVRERGPLRHRGERDARERDAERGPDRERDDDPEVAGDLGVQQRPEHRRAHADHARQHAAARRLGPVQPAQRKDEERGREDVRDLRDLVGPAHGPGSLLDRGDYGRRAHCPGSLFLNIFSIRSVIRKPLTMFVIEAATAIVPRIVLAVVRCSPAMMIDATIAIAEIALVSDISGVCNSRATFWITWKPTKPASRNTINRAQTSGPPVSCMAALAHRLRPPGRAADREIGASNGPCLGDAMEWCQAVVLGLVECITEYLPISSTGHMIFASSLLGLRTQDNAEALPAFEIAIQ